MKKQILLVVLLVLFSSAVLAQGNAFSFQGKLNDGTNPANGRYDLEFKLFDAVVGGTQIGPTVQRPNTTLINGVFSVNLDFGVVAFQNPNATFIEIALKPNGSPNNLTILGPRQQLTVVPYASRAQNSTNADNLGGITAGQYITQTNGDPFYIRNSTNSQANANFNVSGNGEVGTTLRVGAGSTTPDPPLIVFGSARISASEPRLIFRVPLTGSTDSEILSNGGNIAFRTNNATRMSVFSDGRIRIGTQTGASSSLFQVSGTADVGILRVTGGSDLAENFEADATEIKPGMVVAIGTDGKLTLSRTAYNRRVAGIVSGANNLSAGMILPDLNEKDNAVPVALSGRVWVYADATENPIKFGDLLTTADTPGYAMKVTKFKKASGAIIGKAMTELDKGTGLVLVLVTLQ